jgi:hypothetical protein
MRLGKSAVRLLSESIIHPGEHTGRRKASGGLRGSDFQDFLLSVKGELPEGELIAESLLAGRDKDF